MVWLVGFSGLFTRCCAVFRWFDVDVVDCLLWVVYLQILIVG